MKKRVLRTVFALALSVCGVAGFIGLTSQPAEAAETVCTTYENGDKYCANEDFWCWYLEDEVICSTWR